MRHTLQIRLRASEGAILRALGLMERRGFRVEALRVDEAQGDGQAMTVTVRSERPVNLLHRQLDRLLDVIQVAPAPNDTPSANATSTTPPSTTPSSTTKGTAVRPTIGRP